MFNDRADAGRKLAVALEQYKNKNSLVLAIPRGGVRIGYHVAKYLNADFDIIIARKLPFQDNPEAGFGAIAEDGSIFVLPDVARKIEKQIIDETIYQQESEIKRRIGILRQDKPLTQIKDRTVILVDDGIAMGSTMRASIMLCKNKHAKRIIVAAPVAGPRTVSEIAPLVDETFIIEFPPLFYAVAQAYQNWYDVPDSEVIQIMQNWKAEKHQNIQS